MSRKSDVLNRTFTLLPDSDCENDENDSSEEQQHELEKEHKNEYNDYNSNSDCNINNCTTNIDNANRTTIIKFQSSPISLAKLNDSFTIDKYINDFLNSPTLVLLYNKYVYENDLKLILNFLKQDFSTYEFLFNEQFYEAIIDENNYRKYGVSSDDDIIEMKNSQNMRSIANTTQTIDNNNDSSQNLSNNDNNLNKTNVIENGNRKYVLDNNDDINQNINVGSNDRVSNNIRSLSEIDIATLSSVDVVTSSPRFKQKRSPISSNLPGSNSNSSNTDFDFHGSTPSLDSNSDEDKRVLNITYTSFEVDEVQLEKDFLKQNRSNQEQIDAALKTSSTGSLDNFAIVKRSFEGYQYTDDNNFKQTTELNNNIAETNNKENLNSTYSLDDDDDNDDMDVDIDDKMDVDEDNNNKMCANQNNDNQSTNCNRTIIIENKMVTPKIEANKVKLESNLKKPVFRSPLPAPQIPTPSSSVSPSNSSSKRPSGSSSNSDTQPPPVQQSAIPKPSGIPRSSGIPRVTGIPQRATSTTTSSQQSSQQTSMPKVVQQPQQSSSSNEGKLSVISNNTTSIKQPSNTYNPSSTSLKPTGIQQRSIQPPTQINRLTNNNVNTLSSKENKFNTDYSKPNHLIIKSTNHQTEVNKPMSPTTNQPISVNQDTKKIIKKGAIPTCKPSLISTSTTSKPAAAVSYKK